MDTPANWDDPDITWDQPGVSWDSGIAPSSIAPLATNPDTVYVPFSPSSSSNFQFQATFDGESYTVIVTWNLFGQRYYVNIYDTLGTLIVCLAMVGSPNFFNVSLTAGYFTTQLVWRIASGNFEVIG